LAREPVKLLIFRLRLTIVIDPSSFFVYSTPGRAHNRVGQAIFLRHMPSTGKFYRLVKRTHKVAVTHSGPTETEVSSNHPSRAL